MNAQSAVPVLQVSDLDKSIAFYRDVLGFTQQFIFGEPPFYAGLELGKISLHLSAGKGNPSRRGMGSVYVFCDEVEAYYAEIRTKGAEITSPLDTHPYGMQDFQIKDPDGNLIGFGRPVEDEAKG